MVALSSAPVILVIEDRPEMVALVGRTLSRSGYRLIQALDAEHGVAAALEQHPSLIILDVGLPDASGFDVVRDLRKRAYREPVLMLTAHDTIQDKVSGLEAGADDYLAKPFDSDELTARVHALLRRAQKGPAETTLEVGDLTVDLISREVRYGAERILLTQREFELMAFLARNADRVLSRELISRSVWARPPGEAPNIVSVYIGYLRRKLADAGAPNALEVLKRGGYTLHSRPAPAPKKTRARDR